MRTPVTAHSVADPSPRSKMIASFVVATYAVVTILPLLWIFLTGFKTPPDSIAYPPKILFEPSVEGYVNLFHDALAADARISGQPASAADLV